MRSFTLNKLVLKLRRHICICVSFKFCQIKIYYNFNINSMIANLKHNKKIPKPVGVDFGCTSVYNSWFFTKTNTFLLVWYSDSIFITSFGWFNTSSIVRLSVLIQAQPPKRLFLYRVIYTVVQPPSVYITPVYNNHVRVSFIVLDFVTRGAFQFHYLSPDRYENQTSYNTQLTALLSGLVIC